MVSRRRSSALKRAAKLADERRLGYVVLEPCLHVQVVARARGFDRPGVAVGEDAGPVPVADLALSVELADRGQRPGRDLKRREGREDRDIGQVLRRDGAELLRMAEEVDRPVQRFNRLVPALLELGRCREPVLPCGASRPPRAPSSPGLGGGSRGTWASSRPGEGWTSPGGCRRSSARSRRSRAAEPPRATGA